jgi:hypothetical protein
LLHDGVSLPVSKADVIWPCASLVGWVKGEGVGKPDTRVNEPLLTAAKACPSEKPTSSIVGNSLLLLCASGCCPQFLSTAAMVF